MFELGDIEKFLPLNYTIVGNRNVRFNSVDSLFEAKENSLTWIRGSLANANTIVNSCLSSVIICDENLELTDTLLEEKAFIIAENPAITFLRVVKSLYRKNYDIAPSVHPTAIVNSYARFGQNVLIGAYCVIGNCTIGDNTRIETFAKIHDNVTIGKNVLISEYCNVGGQGFGHIKNEHGELENMLHIGQVIIEDNVEIFPYTNIDRATLSSTIVKKNSKIDHYCHIGHNTSVGENTIITAKVVLCGGSSVGNFSWIGVGSIIRDSLIVGNEVVVGMGSIVTKSIPSNGVWAGNPARPIDELKEQFRKINDL